MAWVLDLPVFCALFKDPLLFKVQCDEKNVNNLAKLDGIWYYDGKQLDELDLYCDCACTTVRPLPCSAVVTGTEASWSDPFQESDLLLSSPRFNSLPLLLLVNMVKNSLTWKNYNWKLGKVSNNQNGNLRWHLPLGVRPPTPLNGTNFQTFFYPTFFFCNWILHIWNGFYTSKISLWSPLIIGSKLTFISSSGRWLPTI